MNESQSTTLVLYVEDEETNRFFMEMAFQKAGIAQALRTAVNGKEAIDYLSGSGPFADRSQHPIPALVLLDINMPLVSGFEVLRWVREQPNLKALPVVMFSSSSKDEDKAEARELGANDYLEKPRSVTKLYDMVKDLNTTWLQRNPGSA